ncbi:MAG TPA: hypothetical protein PK156_39525, partial [Polyangium sp.]|nr:hypothetical protein [Polyangium sp.]
VVPFAFLVAPEVTQLACAGAERHTTAQEPEERDDSTDPYVFMCRNEHRRGNECPTREEWYGEMGLCPDGTDNCK